MVDAPHPGAHAIKWDKAGHSRPCRVGHASLRGIQPLRVDVGSRVAVLGQQPLGVDVGHRRVVLMERLNGHVVGRAADRLGEPAAHREVRAVADHAPVEGTKHHPLLSRLEHNALGEERFVHRLEQITSEERLTQRRRDVALKRGHARRVGHQRAPPRGANDPGSDAPRRNNPDRVPPSGRTGHGQEGTASILHVNALRVDELLILECMHRTSHALF